MSLLLLFPAVGAGGGGGGGSGALWFGGWDFMAFGSPFGRAAVVTPSDTVVQPAFKGLYIGGAGDVTVRLVNMTGNVLFSAVPAGSYLPIAPKLVLSTGTTATLMVGLSE